MAEESERNKEANLQVIDTQKREIEVLHEKVLEAQNSLSKGQEALVESEVRQGNDSRLIESLKKDLEIKTAEVKSLSQLLAEQDEKERSKNLEFEIVQKNLEEVTASKEAAKSNNYQVVEDLKAKLADSEAQQLNKTREIETLTLEVEAKENKCRELSEKLLAMKENLEKAELEKKREDLIRKEEELKEKHDEAKKDLGS